MIRYEEDRRAYRKAIAISGMATLFGIVIGVGIGILIVIIVKSVAS